MTLLNRILKLLVIAVCLFFLVSFNMAFAQGLVPCGGPGRPCSICDLGVLILMVTKFLIWKIAIPLAGLMIVVGGIMMVIGSASEARITSAKKILTNAFIGIVIVFTAWLIVDTVIKVLVGGDYRNFKAALQKFGPWNEIPSGKCPF